MQHKVFKHGGRLVSGRPWSSLAETLPDHTRNFHWRSTAYKSRKIQFLWAYVVLCCWEVL